MIGCGRRRRRKRREEEWKSTGSKGLKVDRRKRINCVYDRKEPFSILRIGKPHSFVAEANESLRPLQ